MTAVNLYSLFFNILFISFSVGATGRTVGNGGDAVVCEDSKQNLQSIELLDFYEGRILKGIVTDLGGDDLSVDQKITLALARLQRVSPERAQRYSKDVAHFFEETLFLEDSRLQDIPDTGNIVIPRNCRIAQIANQSAPLYSDDKRYVIDRHLWDALDNTGRAGLILHEVIYKEALELGHQNSVSVRSLNANLCSRRIESMSIQQYTAFLQALGFDTNSIQGALVSILAEFPVFYENGLLKSAKVVDGSVYFIGAQKLHLRDHIRFYSSGKIQQVVLNQQEFFDIGGRAQKLSPYEMNFFESGGLESASFNEMALLQSESYFLKVLGAAHFYENGSLRLANVQEGWVNIRNQKASVGQVLQLDESGRFVQGILNAPISLKINDKIVSVSGGLKLDRQDKVQILSLAEDSILNVGGRSILFSRWGKVLFHPGTELIQSACTAQDFEFKVSGSSKRKTFPARSVLTFELDGSVISSEDRC